MSLTCLRVTAGVPHALPGPAALAAGARLSGGVTAGLRQVRAAGADRGDGAFGTAGWGDGLRMMDMGVL